MKTPAPKTPKSLAELDKFTLAYLMTACFTWDENGGSGEYSTSGRFEELSARFDSSVLAQAAADCARFQSENAVTLFIYSAEVEIFDDCSPNEYAGHDFWLTRNGHGAGFWDRKGVDKFTGEILTNAAHKFGELDLYEGDDGLLYFT